MNATELVWAGNAIAVAVAVATSWAALRERFAARGRSRGPRPAVMQAIVTIAVLLLGAYCVLVPSVSAGDKNWAYGAIGLVIGYWLKG